MADNVPVTAGSGTNIATDDVAGTHFQRVKLVDGTLDSTTAIASGNGVAAGALRVSVASDSTGQVALAAGSAAIGKLVANSGVDIGDVDVTSVIPGSGATNLGKAEDAVHASGDVGVMALGVRKDTPAALAGTDGDYTPLLTDANGRLHVVLGISSAPGGNTPIKYEDDASASGEAGMVILSVRRNSPASSSVTDGDYVTVISDANGRLYTNAILSANSGVDIGDVDVTSVVPGSGATNLGKAEDAAHSSGDVGVMALAVRQDTLAAAAGTTGDYIPLTTDSVGQLNVLAGAPDIAISATPTLDTSAYTAGDSLWTSAVELAAASRVSGGVTILQSLTVVDKDDQKPAFDLFFFDRTVTFGTANGAPSISDADAAYYQGHVSIAASDYKDLGGVSVACKAGVGLAMKANATSLFIAAMVSTTPTHTASGLVFQFVFLRS